MSNVRPLMPMGTHITIRALTGEPAEMAALQRVIESAPTYAQRITGVPPGPADAQSTYSIIPEGMSYDDKFVLGVYREAEMVGCVDLFRGFPAPTVAHLGLLLIGEPFQGQGIGRAAYVQVEELICSWNTCSLVRLGVVRTNEQVLGFWSKLGFMPSGEVKPYRYGNVVSETVILTKPLLTTAA